MAPPAVSTLRVGEAGSDSKENRNPDPLLGKIPYVGIGGQSLTTCFVEHRVCLAVIHRAAEDDHIDITSSRIKDGGSEVWMFGDHLGH
jgi:hypothetical protein